MEGQMTIFDYLEEPKTSMSCEGCICNTCLYLWSGRCRYGSCFDDHRAKTDPFDKAHPERNPRTQWSNWDKPGEQAHWCRGGTLYPAKHCEKYVEYEGSTIEECLLAQIQVFQDGHIKCAMMDAIGCEACIKQSEDDKYEAIYGCPHMRETGCEAHIYALSLMADAILNEGLDMEMCGEQCCLGCTKACGYRCGWATMRKE